MDYQQAIAYLYQQLPMFHRIGKAAYKADLQNTIALCEHLGNPQHTFRSIHVAGTNGKGSTSHLLAAILQAAGYKTGLYTSPHLKSFTERIRINGQEISQHSVVRFIEQHQDFIEKIQPSFFELTVGMAFHEFSSQQVDVAIIEVGLGGRLDSTNVILPQLSVITNISFDHQDILGDTLPQIAFEKAGIIKPDIPVIISEYQPETASVFIEKARQENSPVYFADETFKIEYTGHSDEYLWVNVWRKGELYLKELACGLMGEYQLKNLAGVCQAAEQLQQLGYYLSEQSIRDGIAQVTTLTGLKGRWQKLQINPLIICDTGHNEAGIREVVLNIRKQPFEKLFIVLGVVKDKDLSHILPLLPTEAYYFFCQANIPRALPAHLLQMQALAFGLSGESIPDVNQAIQAAKAKANPQDMIFIGGSTFVVAEIEEL
ncbi:bifunctional folylpolyglutamate synthase/dihydrofolate synthase [Rhodocytophaga rosea]|uniref:Dihydrofolate synthase/folylpolyglutamate synthase n=2 Tax=Rhodocytophaga rosea TaxID=2704465 RepID=A0A6C0GWB8_9BACT|nr:bifunctional folylpolyglutamate synthase/dihydrofolate synthase [Rhodocytophaga rosea]